MGPGAAGGGLPGADAAPRCPGEEVRNHGLVHRQEHPGGLRRHDQHEQGIISGRGRACQGAYAEDADRSRRCGAGHGGFHGRQGGGGLRAVRPGAGDGTHTVHHGGSRHHGDDQRDGGDDREDDPGRQGPGGLQCDHGGLREGSGAARRGDGIHRGQVREADRLHEQPQDRDGSRSDPCWRGCRGGIPGPFRWNPRGCLRICEVQRARL